MLYLIRSYGAGRKTILKVGYTKDLKSRFNDYFTANPLYEKISTREGDKPLEDLIHTCLKGLGLQFKVNGRLNEWFQDDPRVRDIFHYPRKKIENLIWENRERAFNPLDMKRRDSDDFKLYDRLYKTRRRSFNGDSLKVVRGKVINTGALEVDIEYKRQMIKFPALDIPSKKSFNPEAEKIVSDFLEKEFYSTGIFKVKMKAYCDFMDKYRPLYNQELENLIYYRIKDDRFRKYYNFYGSRGCSTREYLEEYLYDGMFDVSKEDVVARAIRQTFEVGKSYTKKHIKFLLSNIYRDLGLSKTAKATDLGNYFKLIRTKLKNESGKYEEGFRLESLFQK